MSRFALSLIGFIALIQPGIADPMPMAQQHLQAPAMTVSPIEVPAEFPVMKANAPVGAGWG